MTSLNRVFLIGNLTRDPELRYIPSGTAVTTFTVAANRAYTNQAGEKKDDPCFVRVIVWARRAEVCGEYLSKGSLVFVEGRLQSRTWQDQNGQKRSTIEVVANNVQFLGKAKGAVPAGAEDHAQTMPSPEDIQQMPEQDAGVPGDVKQNEEQVPF